MFSKITNIKSFKETISNNPTLALYYAEERCKLVCKKRGVSCKAMKCSLRRFTGNGAEAICHKNQVVSVVYDHN